MIYKIRQELPPQMFDLIQSKGGIKMAPDEPMQRRFLCSRLFLQITNRISQTEIVDGARDYRLMTRQMVDAILELSESTTVSKGLFSWVGFDTVYLEFREP